MLSTYVHVINHHPPYSGLFPYTWSPLDENAN